MIGKIGNVVKTGRLLSTKETSTHAKNWQPRSQPYPRSSVPNSTCRRLKSIEVLNKAVDELTEICETVLHGEVGPEDKVIHVAFRGIDVMPLDMVAQLGMLK